MSPAERGTRPNGKGERERRDALSRQSSGLSVAKAGERDCFANRVASVTRRKGVI